jgi:hypothetical protein
VIASAQGLRLAGAAAAVGVIVAAYHFAPVVGPHARLERKDAALLAAAQALRDASDALEEARYWIAVRDQQINDVADRERADAADASVFWKGQCRHAFDAGYAARRCDGGQPDDGVRDLRALQAAGAFKASAEPVPGQPDRTPR